RVGAALSRTFALRRPAHGSEPAVVKLPIRDDLGSFSLLLLRALTGHLSRLAKRAVLLLGLLHGLARHALPRGPFSDLPRLSLALRLLPLLPLALEAVGLRSLALGLALGGRGRLRPRLPLAPG